MSPGRQPPARETRIFRDPDEAYGAGDPAQLPLRERVDWVLNEPASVPGRIVELVVGSLILGVCAVFAVLSLDLEPGTRRVLVAVETGITVLVLVEYLVEYVGGWIEASHADRRPERNGRLEGLRTDRGLPRPGGPGAPGIRVAAALELRGAVVHGHPPSPGW